MSGLRALAAELLGTPVVDAVALSGGDICQAALVRTADGSKAFVKSRAGVPRGFFATEAGGLRWLADGGAPVPAVLGVDERGLALSWHPPRRPERAAAARLGRDLARLHGSGAPAFGTPAPGATGAWLGTLPVPSSPHDTAAGHLAARLRDAADRAALTPADRAAVEELCARLPALLGPVEPPARLHGDLWSGNVLWQRTGRTLLIDPAAHGGHREADLAMLALFGAPHLGVIVAAYQELAPLAAGWQARVALHQLHPLLVHAALFGGGYGARAGAVAKDYLAPR